MLMPIPSRKPDVVVSGVVASPWASNQTTPVVSQPQPQTLPTAALQFPESTRGNQQSCLAARTVSAIIPESLNALLISAGNDSPRASVSVRSSCPILDNTGSIARSNRCLGPAPIRSEVRPESYGTMTTQTFIH